MDLDYDLLDQVLDELQPLEMSVSNSTKQQVERESTTGFVDMILLIGGQANWNLIDQGLAPPLICINCNSRSCEHLATDLTSFYTFEVWDSKQLALYGQQVDQCNLDYGMLN